MSQTTASKPHSAFIPYKISDSSEISIDIYDFSQKFIDNLHSICIRIPMFNTVNHDDQMTLLENGWLEMYLISLVETSGVITLIEDKKENSNDDEITSSRTDESDPPQPRHSYLKRLNFEVDKMRTLGLEPRELDNLRGLILFNSGNILNN